MKKNQPFETKAHPLNGMGAMDLFRNEDLNSLASRLITSYNPDRFDASALRLFVQKGTPVLTIYAVDKLKQEDKSFAKNKLPVRKFKIKMPLEELMNHIKRFDVTLSNEAYDLQDMLVINK